MFIIIEFCFLYGFEKNNNERLRNIRMNLLENFQTSPANQSINQTEVFLTLSLIRY